MPIDRLFPLGDSSSAITRPGALLDRRRLLTLAAGAGMSSLPLAACAAPPVDAAASGVTEDAARAALRDAVTVDMHSHAGRVSGVVNVENSGPFAPVAEPMRAGGLAVVCLAIVPDSPTHRVMPDRRVRPYREPAAGELADYTQRSFARLHELARVQELAIVHGAAELRAARSEHPALIVSAEGADFLEGRPELLDEAHGRWGLRHLQLTHYRVNALGDIQTEAPVHDGYTAFGKAVLRRCNAMGIVVDVAHATYPMVRQAAALSDKPLVLSHTSLAAQPGPRARTISADHARVVAGTGGVIGIWPPESRFPDLPALATGIARMADVVGVDHVGLGTDQRGLVGPSVLKSYRDLPLLAQALLQRGFDASDVRKILGGNYLRVFVQTVGDQPG